MSSRQEEKEQRRKAREEVERQAKAAAARTRRLQIVGGIILAVAVVVVGVVLVVSSGGSSAAPSVKIADLTKAAKAGGCVVKDFPIEGREHTTSPVHYKTNPPTSGNHSPVPAADGIYAPGNTPAKEHTVHALEHGRIEFQYRPGSSQKTIDTLVDVFNEPFEGTSGYHALVFQNQTHMPYPIAATAWGHMIHCNDLSPAALDALRDFRVAYTDKGPEFIP